MKLTPDDERDTLLGSQPQNIARGFQSTFGNRSNSSSVSDDTFLRHRTEHMNMKTFKPETASNTNENETTV
jgi:hypothetical protein